jgi:murein DD-endopeptidase MepM/ murein hydrolase activator NlpD
MIRADVLKIEITVGRPMMLLAWLCLGAAFMAWLRWASTPNSLPPAGATASVVGAGGPTTDLTGRLAAEKDLRDARSTLAVADREADILRYQLQILEQQQALAPDDAVTAGNLRQARLELLNLLDDQREATRRITEALTAFADDGEAAERISQRSQARDVAVAFAWPVTPSLGISAGYHDGAYQARFGVAHQGIDIPTAQGTTILAPADAVVSRVNDRGMGFNSLILSHAGGYATLYGHVTTFLVAEGQTVRAGDPIALSGGTPGTPGAGLLTTGAHLHFEVLKDGEHVDPRSVLPALSN